MQTLTKKVINMQQDDKSLNIIICRNLERLSDYAKDWDNLLIGSVQRSPMLSYAWVSSYIEHRLKKQQDWFVIFVKKESKLLGVLPIIITPNKILGMELPILSTPNDSHTLGGDILVSKNASYKVILKIIDAIKKEIPEFYVLKLYRVVERSGTLSSVVKHKGCKIIKKEVGIGYYFPVTGDFNQYFEKLSKKFRGNLRRASNNISKVRPNKLIIKNNVAVDNKDYTQFLDLEASGWKGDIGSAIKTDKELSAFYRTLISKLAESGFLRWEFLQCNDSSYLAGNMSVRFGDIVVIWKLGYDNEYSKYSPGSLLFKQVLEDAFRDNKISEYNLMSDTEWQTKWKPEVDNYYNVIIFQRKVLPMIFGYIPLVIKLNLKKYSFLVNSIRKFRKMIKN